MAKHPTEAAPERAKHPTQAARDAEDPERATLTELRRTHGRDVDAWPAEDRARFRRWEAAQLVRKAERADADAERHREAAVAYRQAAAEAAAEATTAQEEAAAVSAPTDADLEAAAVAEVDALADPPPVPPVEEYLGKRGRKVRRG